MSINGEVTLDRALDFMLAGKSEFVMHSTKTNQDFVYKIVRKESRNKNQEYIYFVNIKKENEWIYAGLMVLDGNFKYIKGKTGKVDESDLYIRSLLFVINKLYSNEEPKHCLVLHVGKCGRCGKKLTTPDSIATGLGPECSKKEGIPRIRVKQLTK